MIVEWLMDIGVWVLEAFADMLPTFDDANGVTIGIGTFLIPLAAGLASLGVWIPWSLVTFCIGLLVSCYLASVAIKFVLRVASHVPFVGGSG